MTRLLPILLLLAGCTEPAVVATDSSTSVGASTTGPDGSTSDMTTSSDTTSSSDASSSSGGADTSSSSSTGEVFDGPGCGLVPTCEERSVDGNVRVGSVADLSELEGASEILGTLEIADSDLECLDALACLRIVGGDVRILGNAALRSTAGLRNIEETGVGDFNSAGGSVVLSNNDALERLEGFESIQRIPGGVTVWQNAALREIPAFGGLRRLDLLSINDNPVLESLSGLYDLQRLDTCSVNNNPTLCISEVFEVCGDIEEPPGGITDNNDDGC